MLAPYFTGPVAPPGAPAFTCPKCSTQGPEEEFSWKCSGCSRKVTRSDFTASNEVSGLLHLLASEVAFLEDTTKAVAERVWWHATRRPQWLETVTLPPSPEDAIFLQEDWFPEVKDFTSLVHVGSQEAAFARALDLESTNHEGGPFYFHQVRVREGAPVAPRLLVDENEEAPIFAGDEREGYAAVTPYVNRFEASGSVSLLADPRFLEVVETWVI